MKLRQPFLEEVTPLLKFGMRMETSGFCGCGVEFACIP